jgi:hypothetical protein
VDIYDINPPELLNDPKFVRAIVLERFRTVGMYGVHKNEQIEAIAAGVAAHLAKGMRIVIVQRISECLTDMPPEDTAVIVTPTGENCKQPWDYINNCPNAHGPFRHFDIRILP